jgi:hypothetical protein
MFSLSSKSFCRRAAALRRLAERRRLALHRLSEGIETGADRAVDLLAADAHDQAAKQLRIDIGLDLDGLAFAGGQLGRQRGDLIVGQRVSAGDLAVTSPRAAAAIEPYAAIT